MKKIALASLVLALVAAAPSAFAQCPPGSWLCADITIGTAPPPPPTVYVETPPPVYVVPPPQPVYVVPPPQPVVVYQRPAPMYVQQAPVAMYRPAARRGYVGLQGILTGSLFGTPNGVAGIGGFGAGLRFRSSGRFGAELGIQAMHGRDYNGDDRTEVPSYFNGLFYLNPQNRFQVYGLLGVGVSLAQVRYSTESSTYGGVYRAGTTNAMAHGGRDDAMYGYVGAQAGLGAELQVTRRFSLFADARGFVRGRVDSSRDANPEYARRTSDGTTQTSNGSTGVTLNAGAVLYF